MGNEIVPTHARFPNLCYDDIRKLTERAVFGCGDMGLPVTELEVILRWANEHCDDPAVAMVIEGVLYPEVAARDGLVRLYKDAE